ncbi:MAG: branched-chain amino acid ABC transporter permease [Betaproteobacteria bacterium]|nr:MAG: branched-chain amino acid ABC transporter permease [Betaproteobacteria bacterium]
MPERARRRSLAFECALALAAFALLALLPVVHPSKALVDFVIRLAALGIFASSLNILIGYGGMVSFGHGMFFASGAYAFGLLMQKAGTSIPAAIALAVLFSAALAGLVGAICVRLKEIYFAFLTLAFQMLLHSLIISWVPLTGGDQGLMGGIPRPPFLGIDMADQSHLYVFACATLVICLLAMRHLMESPFGYTLRMIRDNAPRAQFLGIRVWRMRLAAFVLAGAFASIGGILMSLFVSGAYPEFAYWTMSGEGIFMLMLGGMSAFLGPLVGTALLLFLNDVVTRFTEYYGLTLGVVILLFALVFRRGVTDFVLEAVQRLGPGKRT